MESGDSGMKRVLDVNIGIEVVVSGLVDICPGFYDDFSVLIRIVGM